MRQFKCAQRRPILDVKDWEEWGDEINRECNAQFRLGFILGFAATVVLAAIIVSST